MPVELYLQVYTHTYINAYKQEKWCMEYLCFVMLDPITNKRKLNECVDFRGILLVPDPMRNKENLSRY